LPQTSFSQPGFGVILPDSKYSREKAGTAAGDPASVTVTEVFDSLVFAKIHLAPIVKRILLPSGEFSKPTGDGYLPPWGTAKTSSA
jgi:hypothetical protein